MRESQHPPHYNSCGIDLPIWVGISSAVLQGVEGLHGTAFSPNRSQVGISYAKSRWVYSPVKNGRAIAAWLPFLYLTQGSPKFVGTMSYLDFFVFFKDPFFCPLSFRINDNPVIFDFPPYISPNI